MRVAAKPVDRLLPVRIARFTTGDDPTFGVVSGELDEFGQPAEDSVVVELAGDPLYAGVQPTPTEHRLSDVRLLAPVIPRSKVVAIGRNYAAHAAELGNDVPEEPLIFLKPNTSVVGPGDQVFYPHQSERVDYEGELAVVVGRLCRDVPEARAMEVVFGYTCANDVTARDQQATDGQWSRAKGYDTFCPLGPWIETELSPDDLAISTRLNGVVKQSSRTSMIVHKIPSLIAYITSCMTLLPGDVILTGTPEGVGPMQVGDSVEVEIEGIGTLVNAVSAR
jgi:2-keto-4-pentenoate hydratase/2-oxohepta-3-ene-1,7-dioic acid hydratase in catechol pathway